MTSFTVHRKKGSPFEILAWAYTEDQTTGRVYFHKSEDKTDRESFVLFSEIVAIDKSEKQRWESLDETLERMRSSPECERALRTMLEHIEEQKQK